MDLKGIGKYNATEICAFFIDAGINEKRYVSNISLQKFLYFSQGLYLGAYDFPLFREAIYAWEFGPVVKDIYHSFKHFGNNSITDKNYKYILGNGFLNKTSALQEEDVKFLIYVWDSFKNYSPFELVELTHDEDGPWYNIYQNYSGKIPRDKEINLGAIKDYFIKTFLVNE